jgi:hypothetical protein
MGVPQGSIIGPGICNLVLDGIENIIDEVKVETNRFTRAKLSSKAVHFLERVLEKDKMTYEHLNPRADIRCVRFADHVIFFGFHNSEIFEKIRIKVKFFLKARGLNIKKKTDNIFLFRPGSQFKFLSFRIVFPSRFNRRKINFGKFTKKKFSPNNVVSSLKFKVRSKIYLCIDSEAYRTFKIRMRNMFRKGYFNYSVDEFLKILNEKIIGFANYFSFSASIRIQLKKLDNEIFKLM